MKIRIPLITFALGVATLSSSPAVAQGVAPCSVYTCMAGMSGAGTTGGPACTAPIDMFFSIVIFDPSYDASATAEARRKYMEVCEGTQLPTNAAILNTIIAEWGYIP